MLVGTQVKLIALMALAKMIAADGALATRRVEQCLLAQQASEAACLRRVCCRLAVRSCCVGTHSGVFTL